MTTRYQLLFAAVERAINEADPIGLLELGAPSGEYAPEIGTIVPRLASVKRLDDITGVIARGIHPLVWRRHRWSTTCVRGASQRLAWFTEPKLAVGERWMVDQNSASWNQIANWLQQVGLVRALA